MRRASTRNYELGDRYARTAGRVYLTGVQALVRLPLLQRQRDAAAGLRTAGFISGYRGSPLGTYDMALWEARELLAAQHVRFEPGVNEDLAATAVWGSQQAQLYPGARYDGVFGIWYGKGPGVDRSVRRAQARQLRRHGAARRRAGAGGRRPGRQVVLDRAPERAGADPLRDPGAESLERAGLPRPRPATASRCRATPAAGSASSA